MIVKLESFVLPNYSRKCTALGYFDSRIHIPDHLNAPLQFEILPGNVPAPVLSSE